MSLEAKDVANFQELVSILRSATRLKAQSLVDGRYSPNYGSKLLSKESEQLFERAESIAIALDQKLNLTPRCETCKDGVYGTDGSGPYNCYECGKKA